jgi:hypothetical protein
MNVLIVHRLGRDTVARMLGAGTIWGLTFSAGLFALGAPACGLPCPHDIAITTAISVAAGILTIGPVAAFYSRR